MKAKITLAVLLLTVGLGPGVAGHSAQADVPDSTSDLYQNDGESGEDASDDCRRSELTLQPEQSSEKRRGQIVPLEDNADTWLLDVDPGTTTVSVLTSEALPDTPLVRELLDFRIDLQVFVFDEPLENPPILACREPAHNTTTRSDDEASVEFDVDAGPTYLVQVEISGVYIGPSAPATAMPLSGHCSPWCFQSYQLAV